MSAKTREAINFLDEKLKMAVTDALAAVMTEKRDDPMRHLATLLKEQSITQTEVQPPIILNVASTADPTRPHKVTLKQLCPKTELMLSKQLLYGLHMPSQQQWQRMLDYIAEEHEGTSKLTVIVAPEDPGKDLIFVDGVPCYGDLTERRAERKRKAMKDTSLHPETLNRLESSTNFGLHSPPSQRIADWVRTTGNDTSLPEANATGTHRTRGTVSISPPEIPTNPSSPQGGLDDTLRPMQKKHTIGLVTEGVSAANAGAAASAFQRTLSDVGSRRRGRSIRDLPTFDALKSAIAIHNATVATVEALKNPATTVKGAHMAPPPPQVVCTQLNEVITALKNAETRFTIEAHVLNPTENMSNPMSLYDRIDNIIGVKDTDVVEPILVVSFRSREFEWRRLLSVVNATLRPLIEYKRLKETAVAEASSTHQKSSMASTNNADYWAAVAKQRAERDAKRKIVAAVREKELMDHKAERMAIAVAERAEEMAEGKLGSTMAATNLGATMSAPSSGDAGKTMRLKEIVLQADDFELVHVGETLRRQKLESHRERRRQREDVIFDRMRRDEQNKKVVKAQAMWRGYIIRRELSKQNVMESTVRVSVSSPLVKGGQRSNLSSASGRRGSMGLGVDGTTKIDAPALIRRVYLQANESMANLLTTKLPPPKALATKHEFWVPRRVHTSPKYDGDVSSDEEFFDQHVVLVPPRSESRRPPLFNALLRLQEVSREVGDDLYEWALNIQKQFVGVSMLQQRAYDALKASALDLIHVLFLEAHHRRLYQQGTLKPTTTFSDYVSADFFELTSWFSSPHFMSLSTAPGVASALQYGPQNPIFDHVLYASSDPKTLPWGGDAPSSPLLEDHKLFMPHWSENAPQLVSTTVDFASAKVFQKQIEYATITGVPCWWFSICPHLGVYVNNQPFVAVRRPVHQDIEGCELFDQLHTSIKDTPMLGTGDSNEDANPSASILSPNETPMQHGLSAASFRTSPGLTSRAVSIYEAGDAADNSPSQIKGMESMTFSYAEGVNIRLRTWFGVHWTEMERKFRNRVASLAANNKYHLPAFVAKAPPPSAVSAPTSPKTEQDKHADELSVSSGDSKVQPLSEGLLNLTTEATLPPPTEQWIDDSHTFTAPNFTESMAAATVVQTLTNMIPPPRPIVNPRKNTPDNMEASRRRTFSRNGNGASVRKRSTMDTGRSMRRLQSVTSMRFGPGASRVSSVMGERTGMEDTRASMMGTANTEMGSTVLNSTTARNVLNRVRTTNKVAEKLFKNPQSRYIRSPGLEVSGYQWWCNLDQFISLIHKGLRLKASIVIGITDESQLFYALVAQLVAHACFAKEDEIYKIYKMELNRIREEEEKVKSVEEGKKMKNFDPDNLGLIADPDDLGNEDQMVSSIESTDEEETYVSARSLLGLHPEPTMTDITFSTANLGLGQAAPTPGTHRPLAFLEMFAALCQPMCKGEGDDVVKAWAAFNFFVRLGAGTYFISSLTNDIEMAERAGSLSEVRKHITSACRTSERYASLFVVYLFLRSLPSGEGTEEPPSFVAWLFNPKHSEILEWLNFIDPWAHCPTRSPDPHHARYSSIYRRWTEDTFITVIH